MKSNVLVISVVLFLSQSSQVSGQTWTRKQSILAPPMRLRRPNLAMNRPCDTPELKHGTVRLRMRGKLVRYQCMPTYTLLGNKYSACSSGRWDAAVPICIKAGCPKIQKPENGIIEMQHYDASATFFCHSGFVVAGNRNAYCNGTHWDRALGICRETHVGAQLSCDFETDDICGWTHDDSHDFDWRRRNGYTSSRLFTGPMHDHTTMKPLEGYFLLSESLPQMKNDKSRLVSPTYSAANSVDACFRLFYHMYGILVGPLAVYVKPVSKSMAEILGDSKYKFFNLSGNQGNLWKEAFFTIDQYDEEFQIVIEASIGISHLSDIAIDDVALMTGADCANEQFQSTTPEVEEAGGVFDVQSCKNRCRETESTVKNETDVITEGAGRNGQVLHCDCFPGCGDLKTCCPDYSSVCSLDDAEDMSTTPDDYATDVDTATDTFSSDKLAIQTEISITTSTQVPTTTTTQRPTTTTTTSTFPPSTTTTEKWTTTSTAMPTTTSTVRPTTTTTATPTTTSTARPTTTSTARPTTTLTIRPTTTTLRTTTTIRTTTTSTSTTTSTTTTLRPTTSTTQKTTSTSWPTRTKRTTSTTTRTTRSTKSTTRKGKSVTTITPSTTRITSTAKTTTIPVTSTQLTIEKDIKIIGKEVNLIPANRDVFHEQNGLSLHTVVMIFICMVVLLISGILLLSRRHCAKWQRHYTGDYGNKKYGSKDAHEEFSEVRYLTGDDELDFTLATDK